MSSDTPSLVDRFPTDTVAIAIQALADVLLTPERRLVEVGRLSSILHENAEIDRASGIDEDEIEQGCRIKGELYARTTMMHLRSAQPGA